VTGQATNFTLCSTSLVSLHFKLYFSSLSYELYERKSCNGNVTNRSEKGFSSMVHDGDAIRISYHFGTVTRHTLVLTFRRLCGCALVHTRVPTHRNYQMVSATSEAKANASGRYTTHTIRLISTSSWCWHLWILKKQVAICPPRYKQPEISC